MHLIFSKFKGIHEISPCHNVLMAIFHNIHNSNISEHLWKTASQNLIHSLYLYHEIEILQWYLFRKATHVEELSRIFIFYNFSWSESPILIVTDAFFSSNKGFMISRSEIIFTYTEGHFSLKGCFIFVLKLVSL